MHEFRLGFHWSLFLSSNKQISGINPDNGSAPTRRQTIIGINDDYLLTHICVTRLNELMQNMTKINVFFLT